MNENGYQLFIGVEVTSRLQDNLDNCKPAMAMYFREGLPEFLSIVRIGDKDYIGRPVDNHFPCQDLDNVYRNVLSLLKKIVPNFRLEAEKVGIHALPQPLRHML